MIAPEHLATVLDAAKAAVARSRAAKSDALEAQRVVARADLTGDLAAVEAARREQERFAMIWHQADRDAAAAIKTAEDVLKEFRREIGM